MQCVLQIVRVFVKGPPRPEVTGFSRRELGPKPAFLTPVPAAVAFLAPIPHPTFCYDEALEAPLAQAQPLPGAAGTSAEGGEAAEYHLQSQPAARGLQGKLHFVILTLRFSLGPQLLVLFNSQERSIVGNLTNALPVPLGLMGKESQAPSLGHLGDSRWGQDIRQDQVLRAVEMTKGKGSITLSEKTPTPQLQVSMYLGLPWPWAHSPENWGYKVWCRLDHLGRSSDAVALTWHLWVPHPTFRMAP